MNQTALKRLLPHLGAFIALLAVAFIFYLPSFQGKVLSRSDNVKARGMQGEMRRYIDETGKAPLWTNAAFGGMPTYQIMGSAKGNLTHKVQKFLMFGNGVVPAHTSLFLSLICAYFMFAVLGVDWRLSIIGAIGFGLTVNHAVLTEAGHSTKLIALAYAPAVLAGVVLLYRKKYLMGAGVLSMFMCLEVLANHLQITFYLGILLGFFGLFQLYSAIKTGEWKPFLIASALSIVGVGLGVLSNTNRIWSTQEYAEETQRGPSELSAKAGQEGLDKDYAFNWSYGIGESFTLLIPNFMGGGSAQNVRNTEAYQLIAPQIISGQVQRGMSRKQAEDVANQQLAASLYWGNQPFTSGPVYYGAALLFLFVLGMFFVKIELRAWAILSLAFILMVAWGKNFAGFNNFLFDHVPLFNKFRSVTMILGLGQLVVAFIALLGLQKFFSKETASEARKKAVMYSTGIVGGLSILLLIFGFGMSFTSPNDANYGQEITSVFVNSRRSLFQADALRTILLVLLTAAVAWTYAIGKLKSNIAVIGIGVLVIFDHASSAYKFLPYGKFIEKQNSGFTFTPTPADEQILADPDPHFRVFDMARGGITDNTDASYWHKSLSGYLAAKLQLYQELIETYFAQGNPAAMKPVLDMLNTKYIMAPGQNGGITAQRTGTNLGNAWFVNEVDLVENADAELLALANTDLKNVAVVQQKYQDYLSGIPFVADSLENPENQINLTYYHPDTMRYAYNSDREQLAVFSEIYYPPSKGWKILLDGQEMGNGFIKADFALRAARLPAGQHNLEMIFAPRSFYSGVKFSYLGSLISLLLFFGGFIYIGVKKDWAVDGGIEFDDPEPSEPEATKKPSKTQSRKVTSKGKPVKKKRKS